MDPISDGPVTARPRGFIPPAGQRERLLAELTAAGVDLGAFDRRIVDWVAGWTWSEVATVASWVRRASRGGGR